MNCCNNENHNDNKQKNSHKGHLSHLWMMLLCCGAPVLILMLLPFVGSLAPGADSVIRRVIPFLCPLMMLAMLPMMLKGIRREGKKE